MKVKAERLSAFRFVRSKMPHEQSRGANKYRQLPIDIHLNGRKRIKPTSSFTVAMMWSHWLLRNCQMPHQNEGLSAEAAVVF